MNINLTGTTRLNLILGDPVAQVKSPNGVTRAFADRGVDAVLVPFQVGVEALKSVLTVVDSIKNLDGIVVTVPHKFACFTHCSSVSERADRLGVVNVMRRGTDGGWHGDMVDGLGFVGAIRAKGFDPSGKRALLVGAGGAGSAIALALLEAGVHELAIHDVDSARRDQLVERLKASRSGDVIVGSADPTGFDLVGNATPAGMMLGDPLPIDTTKLDPSTFVGCVITVPAASPLIEDARRIGCPTSTGTDMYNALQTLMVDFFCASEVLA